MTTPKEITTLLENQIFVFGSNLNGSHGGGSAKLAQDKFGAIDGVGEGLTGQSYAFPTLDKNMKKVSKKALLESKAKLYKCAEENPTKQFLVTKVGCGIAGFKEEEMKEIFKGLKPSNIILPAGWSIIKGYKAFKEGLMCRDMQYEFGKEYRFDGDIKPCNSGYHFCKSLGDVYSFYSFGDVVCEVESEGEVIDEENKSVTNHLRLVRMLNPQESKANKNETSSGYLNSGDCNSGDRNSGDRNSGDWNSGDRNSGDWNSGDRNSGDRNSGDWNSGNRNTGFFNSETPKDILVFNKKCSREKWDRATKPNFIYYFDLIKWIDFSGMSDEEKEQYPSCKTTGGYLKKLDYKEAFQESFKNATESDIKLLKALPNFNKKVFEEISGIKL